MFGENFFEKRKPTTEEIAKEVENWLRGKEAEIMAGTTQEEKEMIDELINQDVLNQAQ